MGSVDATRSAATSVFAPSAANSVCALSRPPASWPCGRVRRNPRASRRVLPRCRERGLRPVAVSRRPVTRSRSARSSQPGRRRRTSPSASTSSPSSRASRRPAFASKRALPWRRAPSAPARSEATSTRVTPHWRSRATSYVTSTGAPSRRVVRSRAARASPVRTGSAAAPSRATVASSRSRVISAPAAAGTPRAGTRTTARNVGRRPRSDFQVAARSLISARPVGCQSSPAAPATRPRSTVVFGNVASTLPAFNATVPAASRPSATASRTRATASAWPTSASTRRSSARSRSVATAAGGSHAATGASGPWPETTTRAVAPSSLPSTPSTSGGDPASSRTVSVPLACLSPLRRLSSNSAPPPPRIRPPVTATSRSAGLVRRPRTASRMPGSAPARSPPPAPAGIWTVGLTTVTRTGAASPRAAASSGPVASTRSATMVAGQPPLPGSSTPRMTTRSGVRSVTRSIRTSRASARESVTASARPDRRWSDSTQ
jgi:hypothetical protein